MYLHDYVFKINYFVDLRLVYNSDTVKLFRLLQQCQERALTIISSLGKIHAWGGGVGRTHINMTRMLIVSLRGANHRCWS